MAFKKAAKKETKKGMTNAERKAFMQKGFDKPTGFKNPQNKRD